MITSHVYGEERLWTFRNLCVSLSGSHTQSLTCAAPSAGSRGSSPFLLITTRQANRSRVDPAGRGRRGDGADAGDDDDGVCMYMCVCVCGTHLERRLDFVADGHFGDGCRLAGVVFAMDTMEVGCRKKDSGCRGSCGRKRTKRDSMKVVQHGLDMMKARRRGGDVPA